MARRRGLHAQLSQRLPAERGWLQVCLMGSYSRVHLVGLLGVLREHCPRADHDLEEREPTSVSRPRSGAYNSGA
ncbi:MAG: hypothetical protein WKH64_09220 [Chloroflexia bacterium]